MITHDTVTRRWEIPAVLFEFVDEHYRKTYSEDTGALLGQLSKMAEEDYPMVHIDQSLWHEAVCLAVSAH